MLVHLHVKNFALIEEVEIDINNNLNILTGETGAGKSIIIGSINAVLGGKVNKDMIRTGSDHALIELLFQVNSVEVLNLLKNYDINIESKELLITRKINSNGRSVFRINGQVVTSSIVKEIASSLIHIHGQHDNQALLNKKNHITLLDKFCGSKLQSLINELTSLYDRYIALNNKIDYTLADKEKRNREISFLDFEINEISDANLVSGEDKKLEEEYRFLSNSRKIQDNISTVFELITDSNSMNRNIVDSVGQAVNLLQMIKKYDSGIEGLIEQIQNIEILLLDFNRDIVDYLSDIDIDQQYIEEVGNRINLINNLKMKYGQTIEEILSYKQEKENRLEELINYEKYINNIHKEINQVEEDIEILCKSISEIRLMNSELLSNMVKKALADLNFINTEFEIEVKKKDKFSTMGWDDVEFLISMNPGEPLKPLSKVASGGELSRIMLAIKSVLAHCDDISTLVFDEIDSGISGRTAQMVAEKLAKISRKHQVICITHLPQIASMGDTHFVIEKTVDNNTTNTYIRPLNKETSVMELARLLGGVQITEVVIKNAKEMKNLANRIKKEA